MLEKLKITLTLEELMVAFVKCDSELYAFNVGEKAGLSENEIESIIEKGLSRFNEQKDQLVVESQLEIIEEVSYYWGEANKKIHFENGKDYLEIFYDEDDSNCLIHILDNGLHTFTKSPMGFYQTLCDFYGYELPSFENSVEMNIEISGAWYNALHEKSDAQLKLMMNDDSLEWKIKQFIKDFKNNGKKVNQIIFESGKYSRKQDLVQVFLPGEQNIWHIDYDQIKNHKLILYSNTVQKYFEVLDKVVLDFLRVTKEKDTKKPKDLKKEEPEKKKFSFKRGISFFTKSNILLLIILAVLYINKSSWGWDGGDSVFLLILQSEMMVILLSMVACLKPREYEK